jgi:undecaprenyl-diphosphatase
MKLLTALNAYDERLLRIMRSQLNNQSAQRILRTYSRAGEHGAVWYVFGLFGGLRDRKRRTQWLRATSIVGAAYLFNIALKYVIKRPRPHLDDLPPLIGTPTKLSFPSAHATTSFTAVQVFGSLVPKVYLYSVALTLAGSRLLLGVHYPSDLIAGYLLGTVIGRFTRQ